MTDEETVLAFKLRGSSDQLNIDRYNQISWNWFSCHTKSHTKAHAGKLRLYYCVKTRSHLWSPSVITKLFKKNLTERRFEMAKYLIPVDSQTLHQLFMAKTKNSGVSVLLEPSLKQEFIMLRRIKLIIIWNKTILNLYNSYCLYKYLYSKCFKGGRLICLENFFFIFFASVNLFCLDVPALRMLYLLIKVQNTK